MRGRTDVEEARQWAEAVRPLIADVEGPGAVTLQEVDDALDARGVRALQGGA